MKLLFDRNISLRITRKLPASFSESLNLSDCGLYGGKDSEIWNYAKENGFSIITDDSDFFDLSLIKGHPPKVIWIRTGNRTTDELLKLLIINEQQVPAFANSDDYLNVSCLELE